MEKNYSVSNKVQEGGIILTGLGTIGFVGIIWLMIYGFLGGSLDFDSQRLTQTYTNESGYAINETSYTLINGVSTTGFISLSVTNVYNATDGVLITLGNYTVDSTTGTIIGSAGRTDNWTSANITYIVTYKSQGELNTDGVIDNMSEGFSVFFSFAPAWFTIAAIVLLIFMLVGLLGVVMLISQKYGKKGSSSGYD